MKSSVVKSLLMLLFIATSGNAKSMCSSQLDYLHKVVDKLEEKVFCDTVSTIEYRENVHYAGDTFTIKLFQKPCLVVDNMVKRVARTVCIRDSFGNFVDQRSYVVDHKIEHNSSRAGVFVVYSLWYTFWWNLGFAFFLADAPRDVRNVAALALGVTCGLVGAAELK